MREFTDSRGQQWKARTAEERGGDYKGRYFFVMESADGERAVSLTDIRWNSLKTARRTLATMSEVELRRRLRSATGRDGAPLAPRLPARAPVSAPA